MWKIVCVALVVVALAAIGEAGRGKKSQWKMRLCQFGESSAPCDGPFDCASRPIGRRAEDDDSDTPAPELKVCVQKSCESDTDCTLEGFEVRCLGRPNHKRCALPKPVHTFYGACRVAASNGTVVRERECLAPSSECGSPKAFTYLETEYTLSKCIPSPGSGPGEGGRKPGRGRGGRRRGGGGRRGGERQEVGAEMEGQDEATEEQPAGKNGRRGGRGRGGRGRNNNRRQEAEEAQ